MTGLRIFSLLITRNSCLIQNNKSAGKRSLFLSAYLNARPSRKRGNVRSDKPYSATIVDLKNQILEADHHKSVNRIKEVDHLKSPNRIKEADHLKSANHVAPQIHDSKPIGTTKPISKAKEVEHPLPFPFVRLEKNDTRLSEVMMTVKSRKNRKEANLVMLEGRRLIEDALSAGVRPHCFFFSRPSDIASINVPTGEDAVPIYKIMYKEMKMWSDLVTCPGVIGIFNIPSPNVVEPPEEAMPLTIICDNVRDPGNLGSVLRVAAGVGSSKVILTKGCCDLWNLKVLRSAAGAHFRIPIETGVEWSKMTDHVDMYEHIFIADNHEDLSLKHQSPSSEEFNDTDKQMASTDSDNYSDSDDEVEHEISRAEEEENLLKEEFSNALPYFEIDFVNKSPMALIIGGETHGVSREALQFARLQPTSSRLNIPLFNCVESLNSAVALSVISFEIQRQFILSNLSSSSGKPGDSEQHSSKSQI